MQDQRDGERRDADAAIDEGDAGARRSDSGSEAPGWAGEPAAARRATEDVAATPTDIPEDLRDTHGNAAPGVGDATQAEVRRADPGREESGPSERGSSVRIEDIDPERPYFERGQVGPYVTGETQLGREGDDAPSSGASTAVPAADADPAATYPLPDRVERPHASAVAGSTINERLTTDPSGSRTAEPDLPDDRPMGPPGGETGPVEEPPGGGTWGSG